MYNQFPQYQMPQMPQMMRQYSTTPRQEVIRVNGKGGADAFQLMPNSSALLLDETAPIVWLVTTDGAGFKTTQPYEIKPYMPQAPADQSDLEARIKRLEDVIYAKSDHATAEQTATARQYSATVPTVQAADGGAGSATDSFKPSLQRQNDTGTV